MWKRRRFLIIVLISKPIWMFYYLWSLSDQLRRGDFVDFIDGIYMKKKFAFNLYEEIWNSDKHVLKKIYNIFFCVHPNYSWGFVQ